MLKILRIGTDVKMPATIADVCFDALRAAANLAREGPLRVTLVDEGAVDAAVDLSTSSQPRIRSHAAGLLANLSLDSTQKVRFENRKIQHEMRCGVAHVRVQAMKAMLEPRAAAVVVSLLSDLAPEVQRSACLALANVTTLSASAARVDAEIADKLAGKYAEEGALQKLTALMKLGDSEMQLHALRAAVHLARTGTYLSLSFAAPLPV
jgi:hypothetical protein